MKYSFIISSMAILGVAMANTMPSQMGVEVIRQENGQVMVREVPHSLSKRCTNCVNVGNTCTIGEGNCKTSQHASCTDCGGGHVICVDTSGGSCEAP